jgi:hypothetical protein
MAGKDHYACAMRIYGGTEARENDAYLKRSIIEPGAVAGIRRKLSPPQVMEELQRRVRQRTQLTSVRTFHTVRNILTTSGSSDHEQAD